MPESIQIRNFQARDTNEVFGLLSSFYANISSLGDWEALYLDNPHGRAVISLAEFLPEARIIGHYSAIKMPMCVLGQSCLGAKGEGEIFDLSLIKELVKKGVKIEAGLSTKVIGHTLQEALKENIKLVCTNPSGLALKSHVEAGFKVLKQDFDIFVRVFNKNYLSHLLSAKIGLKIIRDIIAGILAAGLRVFYFFKALSFKEGEVELEQFESFSPETDIFTGAFTRAFACITIERRHAHLNWRFQDKSYLKFLIKLQGEPIGYALLHIFKNPNGFREANLVDYFFLPQRWDKFAAAVNEISKVSCRNKCDLLRVNYLYDLKEKFGLSRKLKGLFFLRRPDPRNIVVYIAPQFIGRQAEILEANNWLFTDLYFENY